jgi:hypothetical protein
MSWASALLIPYSHTANEAAIEGRKVRIQTLETLFPAAEHMDDRQQ